jgi:hypothetical protein
MNHAKKRQEGLFGSLNSRFAWDSFHAKNTSENKEERSALECQRKRMDERIG